MLLAAPKPTRATVWWNFVTFGQKLLQQLYWSSRPMVYFYLSKQLFRLLVVPAPVPLQSLRITINATQEHETRCKIISYVDINTAPTFNVYAAASMLYHAKYYTTINAIPYNITKRHLRLQDAKKAFSTILRFPPNVWARL